MGNYVPVDPAHWRRAAEAVNSLIDTSLPMFEIVDEYAIQSNCPKQVFNSTSRKGDVTPYRFGLSYLLNKCFKIPPRLVLNHITSTNDRTTLLHSCRVFATECENRGITISSQNVPYSSRLVKRVLEDMDIKLVPKMDLMDEYSQATGVEKKDITSPAHYVPPFISDVRGGFFYAAAINLNVMRYITKDPRHGELFKYWKLLADSGFESVPDLFREEIRKVRNLFPQGGLPSSVSKNLEIVSTAAG